MFNLSETVRAADSGLVLPQTSSPFSIEQLPEAQSSSKQDLNQTLSALGEDTLVMPSENSVAFAAAWADVFQAPQADAAQTETAYLDLPETQALRAEEITVHTPSAAPKWLGGLAGLGLLGALGAAGGGSGGGSSDSAAKPSAPAAETVRPVNVAAVAPEPAQNSATAAVQTESAKPSETVAPAAAQPARPVVEPTVKPSEKTAVLAPVSVVKPVVKPSVEKVAEPSVAVVAAAPKPVEPVAAAPVLVAEPKAVEVAKEVLAPVVQPSEVPVAEVETAVRAADVQAAEPAETVLDVVEKVEVMAPAATAALFDATELPLETEILAAEAVETNAVIAVEAVVEAVEVEQTVEALETAVSEPAVAVAEVVETSAVVAVEAVVETVSETVVEAVEVVPTVEVLETAVSESVETVAEISALAVEVSAQVIAAAVNAEVLASVQAVEAEVLPEVAALPVETVQLSAMQEETPVQNEAVATLANAGVSVFAAVLPETLPQAAENAKPYVVGMHETYGKFIDAAQFGTDMSGETDSLAAIQAALQAAHEEGAMLYLSGKLYVSDQIKIDQNLSNVKGLFGDGMGETQIRFDKPQVGVHNPNTNEDDVRAFAGVLVDGVSGTTIADLSVAYTGEYYRKGLSYFGKVNGIQVNDADNTLITKVEVSGANRAGVAFTSTAALSKDPNGNGKTFKARVAAGEVDETYEGLPLGENNRIEHSHLHHNRVAGALVSYQKDFVGADNLLERNGHEADGGTGYGMTAMAGSYNFGIIFSGNTTDHNYRKGLDVHDGTDILIQNNVLNGDRLYGISVYNRQFAMDKVTISGNVIQQDAHFRLAEDDDLGSRYHGYSGIQLMTNTQFRDLHTADNAMYSITGNTISGLAVYNNAQQTYGIEFRNHEQKINYTVDISGNHLSGDSARYIIGILNDTRTPKTRDLGPGSGTINIVGNTAEIGEIIDRSVPIYVEEKNFIETLRGHVSVSENNITISKSNGYVEAVQLLGNAETYTVSGNTFNLGGTVDRSIVNIVAKTAGEPTATISDNVFHTDLKLIRGNWLQVKDAAYISLDNEHNGKQVEMKSNMAAEKAAELVAQHEAAEAAELAKTWQADGSRSSFEGILTEGNTAQAGIGAWEFAQAEAYAYDANETFTVDTAAGAAYL